MSPPTDQIHNYEPTGTVTTGRAGNISDSEDSFKVTMDEVFLDKDSKSNECTKEDLEDITSNEFLKKTRQIFETVADTGMYNFQQARIRVPSGLNISAWEEYLKGYEDRQIVEFLAYGWPISFSRSSPVASTLEPHSSGKEFPESVNYYIDTELGFQALLGPFEGPPVQPFHASPIMSRPKKDSEMRRIVLDLSWRHGFSINDGIDGEFYLEDKYDVHLPTIDLIEKRVLELGRGCYLYKTDLSRGYRQLRVDPIDWPLLGFKYQEKFYMDICPPFGLRSAAMMMQRTSQAIAFIQNSKGFLVFPYIDHFGGGEKDKIQADGALLSLQKTLGQVGLVEAKHKVCLPSQMMIWLGILFNTLAMTMSIPKNKLSEIMECLKGWMNRTHATRREMQSILGMLQFVAKVAPPVRLFTNRMLECLRDTPRTGSHTLLWGFKKDVEFFLKPLPQINGVRIIEKSLIVPVDVIELDACLTGCGAWCGSKYYGRPFPKHVLDCQHNITHLEMLNLVVAVKLWAKWWAKHRVEIRSDNTNTCLTMMTGKSRDPYMQACTRELYQMVAANDIDINVVHTLGLSLQLADALSREHTNVKFKRIVKGNKHLRNAYRVYPIDKLFHIENEL